MSKFVEESIEVMNLKDHIRMLKEENEELRERPFFRVQERIAEALEQHNKIFETLLIHFQRGQS